MKKLNQLLERIEAIKQGYFDGRFKHRVIENKKKNLIKKLGRKKVSKNDLPE